MRPRTEISELTDSSRFHVAQGGGVTEIRRRDTGKAGFSELLAAGRAPGSPQLTALGPNMPLARDLLVAGRRDAVVTYLDECAKFWDSPVVRQWQAEVAAGRTPDFGGSLRS